MPSHLPTGVPTNFRETEGIIIHLTVTGRCYARCEGCINSSITFTENEGSLSFQSLDTNPMRDAGIIRELARSFPSQQITLAFYGGEPFLAADKMEQVRLALDSSSIIPPVRYMVYTNGELLEPSICQYPELIKNMWLFSVSIDGDEKQHRRVRPGTELGRTKANLRVLKSVYSGNILFWSTLREQQSLFLCFEEFMRMYGEGLVNHFFWHWADLPEPYRDFPAYTAAYSHDLEAVMDTYVEHCRRGDILPIAHINELILYLMTDRRRGHTACGVELARNFDIIDGRVCACADLPQDCGTLNLADSQEHVQAGLASLADYKDTLGCYHCDVHPYCGGRCPVQAIAGSAERTRQICRLMRLHVGLVAERLPEIADGLKRNGISLQDIYDRSAFMAAYTDVVP